MRMRGLWPAPLLCILVSGCGCGRTDITGRADAQVDSDITPESPEDIVEDEATVPDASCWDNDGDGHMDEACGGDDCDDTRDDTYPGAPEGCDGTWDNDCDGDETEIEIDADGDGYAPASCSPPEGMTDCDDTDEGVFPGADEICDLVDQDCDGSLLDAPGIDDDGDTVPDETCGGNDCDDEESTIHGRFDPPTGITDAAVLEASEVCDMIDQDCDGTWADGGADDDLDGYLDEACGGEDCDDSLSSVYPGAVEVCLDGIDQDCDTLVDGPVPMLSTVAVTSADGYAWGPSMVWTGSEYGLSWTHRDSSLDLFFARISPSGSVIGSYVRVTELYEDGFYPSMVWTGSEFVVAWAGMTHEGSGIHLTRLSPAGDRIAYRRMSDSGGSTLPTLVWTGSELGLSWGWYSGLISGLIFTRLTTLGDKAGSDLLIADISREPGFQVLSWTGSEFGLTWEDSGSTDAGVYITRISPDGSMIESEMRIAGGTGTWLEFPTHVWSGSEFGVAWCDVRHGSREIYFARVSGDGILVAPETRITSTSGGCEWPVLAWTGSEYGALWQQTSSGYKYFARISALGNKVGTEWALPGNPWDEYNNQPSIAWTRSEFGVAWTAPHGGSHSAEMLFNRIGYCD